MWIASNRSVNRSFKLPCIINIIKIEYLLQWCIILIYAFDLNPENLPAIPIRSRPQAPKVRLEFEPQFLLEYAAFCDPGKLRMSHRRWKQSMSICRSAFAWLHLKKLPRRVVEYSLTRFAIVAKTLFPSSTIQRLVWQSITASLNLNFGRFPRFLQVKTFDPKGTPFTAVCKF